MDIKKQLASILDKQMDRKDFLRHVAIGTVALVGGGVLLRLGSTNVRPPVSPRPDGYGAAAYGGGNPDTRRVS